MKLSEREQQIVERLGQWDSPKTIARELGIKVKTVYAHICNIAYRLPGDDPPLSKVRRWSVETKSKQAA